MYVRSRHPFRYSSTSSSVGDSVERMYVLFAVLLTYRTN